MTLKWKPNPPEKATEVHPETGRRLAANPFQTWTVEPKNFPDGICMNCRKCPGNYYPQFTYYVCDGCQLSVRKALGRA